MSRDVEISRDNLIYLAGIIDGEGSLYIRHKAGRHSFDPAVTIGNTDARLIDWISNRWKGSVSVQQPKNPRAKIFAQWTVVNKAAADLLIAVRPFLVLKGERADLLLALWNLKAAFGVGRHSFPAAFEDAAGVMKEAMAVLNAKGAK